MNLPQPTRAAALVLALTLASCADDGPAPSEVGDEDTQSDTGEAPTYTLEAEFVGLKGGGLRLRLGDEELEATDADDLSFASPLSSGEDWMLEIVAQPRWPAQTCVLDQSAGVVAEADVIVNVSCVHDSPPGLDDSFGDGGLVILDDFSGFSNSGDVPFDLALAPDGGLVVAGQALSTNEFDGVLWRLDASGQPELGFGEGGLVLYDKMLFETFIAADVAADGSVYAVGRHFLPMAGADLLVVHVLDDGTLDPAFGDGGVALFDNLLGGCPDQFVVDAPMDHMLTSEGLLISGTTTEPDCEDTDAFVARIDLVTGALDPSFGGSGVLATQGGGDARTPNDSGNALALRPDGRVWMSGLNTASQGIEQESAVLWRIDSSGALDVSFADTGAAQLSPGDSSHAWAVATGPDGSAVVAGEIHGDVTTLIVWHVLDTGGLDPDFADAGTLQVSNSGRHVSARRIAVDGAGRVVVLGTRNNLANDADLAVWRLDPGGQLDPSFADGGLFVWDGLGRDVGWGLAIDAQDRVLASASRVDESDDVEMVVLRVDG